MWLVFPKKAFLSASFCSILSCSVARFLSHATEYSPGTRCSARCFVSGTGPFCQTNNVQLGRTLWDETNGMTSDLSCLKAPSDLLCLCVCVCFFVSAVFWCVFLYEWPHWCNSSRCHFSHKYWPGCEGETIHCATNRCHDPNFQSHSQSLAVTDRFTGSHKTFQVYSSCSKHIHLQLGLLFLKMVDGCGLWILQYFPIPLHHSMNSRAGAKTPVDKNNTSFMFGHSWELQFYWNNPPTWVESLTWFSNEKRRFTQWFVEGNGWIIHTQIC